MNLSRSQRPRLVRLDIYRVVVSYIIYYLVVYFLIQQA